MSNDKCLNSVLNTLNEHKQNNDNEKGYIFAKQCFQYYKFSILFLDLCGYFAYYNNDYEMSLKCYKMLQENANDEYIISTAEFNNHFSAREITNKYIDYPKEKVEILKNTINNGIITFTMTTCKRIDLFQNTINSFINCCKDVELIDRWICIDDNSSNEDREQMKLLYPFFEFVFKGDEEKGHPKSMNKIIEMLDTPYQIHMEDDWVFYHETNYITRMLDIITEKDEYKQVLFNLNYSEIPGHFELAGGVFKQTKQKQNYYEHIQCPIETYRGKKTCSYWPHFSFRPSLIKTEIYSILGKYNELAHHFEMEYAERYIEKKFISCFLPYIVSKHIGKLTSDKDGVNAYKLNDEEQFVKKPVEEPNVKPTEKALGKAKVIEKTLGKVYINLDRRQDRDEKFRGQLEGTKLDIKRISAVHGKTLKMTHQIY